MRDTLSSLITRMILLCVIPLLLLTIAIALVRVHDINDASEVRAQQVADNVRVVLDAELGLRVAGLQTLADSPFTAPLELPLLYREAQAFERHFGGRVAMADRDLHQIFNTRIPLGQPQPAQLPMPKGRAAARLAIASGQPAVGDSFLAQNTGTRVVGIAVPVRRDGAIWGVLVNTIEIRSVQQFVARKSLPEGWHVKVTDSAGVTIARLPEDGVPPNELQWRSRSELAGWEIAVSAAPLTFYQRQVETLAWALVMIAAALAISTYLGRRTGRRLYHAMLSLTRKEEPAPDIVEVNQIRNQLDTERRSRAEAEQARRDSEARWRYAIEGSGDGLWDWDLNSGKVFYSERWKSMLGFSDGDLLGHVDEWGELVHPDDKERVLQAVDAHLDGSTPEFVQEYRIRCKDGSWKWMLARGKAMPVAPGSSEVRMIGTNADITARKEAEAQIEYLAYYDPLTGLENRKLLHDRIWQAVASSARSLQYGALVFIDLDGFKAVNDMWGHSIGDQMLMQAARRMKQCMRTGDTVARLGGDEFVVLVQNLGPERDRAAQEVATIAAKVLDAFFPPFTMEGHEFHGGASLGITLFRDEQLSVDALLGQADSAMYRAKADGGNVYRYFDADLQASLLELSTFEAELRQSIHRGQLHLVFQPQVDCAGRIIGTEALVRWHHPSLGEVPPSRFIPVAEKDNFIVELGQWVMREACATLTRLNAHPGAAEASIAVNVSARQFLQPDFVGRVEAALYDAGADPSRLKLELTESIFAQDIQSIAAKMAQLRRLGVTFSLDDFGTGYSCLAYLKQLPFDQIKIDRAFVKSLPGEPQDAAIVHTIIALCQRLQIAVIAEGVETESQRSFLEQSGCRMFQGSLFGRPMAAEELMERRDAVV